MLAQSTDSGQLIAAAVIKLFHAMKLQVQDLRGVGIQVQLLEGHARQDSAGLRTRSIKEMLLERRLSGKAGHCGQCENFCFFVFFHRRPLLVGNSRSRSSFVPDAADVHQETTSSSAASSSHLQSSPEPVPGTSRDLQACWQTPKRPREQLNLSIEVPSPSQVRISWKGWTDGIKAGKFEHFFTLCKVDRSVLEALPAELREQVERSWSGRDWRPSKPQPAAPLSCPTTPPRPPTSVPAPYTPPVGTLLLQIPNSPGIILELPNFSQARFRLFLLVCSVVVKIKIVESETRLRLYISRKNNCKAEKMTRIQVQQQQLFSSGYRLVFAFYVLLLCQIF